MKKHRMWSSMMIVCIVFVVISMVTACASSHGPVLYPNAKLQSVGKEQAQRDIDACARFADEYVKSNAGGEIATNTAVGGAGGAVVGGAVGAVTGNIGRGAGIGAVAGAAGGLVRGTVRSSQPSPVYKNFVYRCLREEGYDPIGWE